jgi:hypothetical protein
MQYEQRIIEFEYEHGNWLLNFEFLSYYFKDLTVLLFIEGPYIYRALGPLMSQKLSLDYFAHENVYKNAITEVQKLQQFIDQLFNRHIQS